MPSIERPLGDGVLVFGLQEETQTLTGSSELARGGRTARTLVKDGPMRVTLVALGPEGRLAPHRADGPILIQPVFGTLKVQAGGEERTIEQGQVLALGAGIEHSVESIAGGAFLLTVAKEGG